MKPALYYSVRRGPYSTVARVVAVTTEKRNQWYGRYVDHNEATNGNVRDLRGRFETPEAAQAKIDAIKAVEARFEPLMEANRRESSRLWRERDEAMNEAVAS